MGNWPYRAIGSGGVFVAVKLRRRLGVKQQINQFLAEGIK